MQPEPPYTSDTLSYASYLPLESLILYLKDNGFSIKPDDYIEILKVVERFQPATLQDAGNLICPLIATNEEEQARFHIVFKKLCEADVLPPPTPPLSWQKKLLTRSKNLLAKKRTKYFLFAIPLAIVLLSWLFNVPSIWRYPRRIIKAHIVVSNTKNNPVIEPGDSIVFNALSSFSKHLKDTAHTKYDWNIGNGWQYEQQDKIVLVPDKPGSKTVMLRIAYGNNPVSIDTAAIYVCGKMPAVSLSSNTQNLLTTDSTIRIDAAVSTGGHKDFPGIWVWIFDGDTVKRNSSSFERQFPKAGAHTIAFVMIPYGDSTKCAREFSTNFTVDDPNAKKFGLQLTQAGDAITPPKKIKNWLENLALYLFLSALITSLALRWIRKRKKEALKKLVNAATEKSPAATNDKKPIFEIPLENRQQQLIVSDPVMNDVMRFMLQRTMDESLGLNIPQTVQNTIRSGGIPDLVYTNKLRPNDYLIVVDSTITNSQQLKLFEYLIKTFRHENISIVRFFYQDNFSKFYNEEYPAGFSLKRLAELYKNYTLIIYGDARHLVYDAYPVIDPEKLNELADWESKGILTPVPFKDWSIKEKLIGEQIILLPADAEGQLRFIKAINEKLLRHRDYLLSEKGFYTAEKYDFTETDELKTYLDDEDLFQCICAIAIYPKIRWEVLIELGKAVLQSRGCPEKMNYTSLLKLVRIAWLREGYFPEHTRLELLKQLGINEEIVARKKLVELFQYADLYFKDSYFFSNEKKIQEITNKFIIHANDPANNKSYASSKEQFEALWKENKILDAPLKGYLDNSQKEPWHTPLVNADKITIGAKEYFDKDAAIPQPSKFTKWIRIFVEITGACLLLLILLSKFGNNFAESGIAKSIGISTTDSSRLIHVSISISPFGKCLGSHNDSSRLKNIVLSVYNDTSNIFSAKDSIRAAINNTGKEDYIIDKSFNVPYYALVSGLLKLNITWQYTDSIKMVTVGPPTAQSGNYYEDTTITGSLLTNLYFTTNSLKAIINGCKDTRTGIRVNYNNPSLLTDVQKFASLLSGKGYNNTTPLQEPFTDSLVVKYYIAKDKAVAETLAKEASNYFKKNYTAKFSDESSPGTPDFNFEIFVYKKLPDSCIALSATQLPASLTEIWKGQVNNRLTTFDPAKNVIYYSTGNKKDYGTYGIVTVCLSGNSYKIIVTGNNKFRTYFVKNVSNNSFDLALCPETFASLAEAENHGVNDCGKYDKMELYYENDVNKIFLPLNQQATTLFASESKKLGNQADILLSFSATKKNTISREYYENTELSSSLNQLQLISNEIDNQNGKQNYFTNPTKKFTATPFDRNYCIINIIQGGTTDPCDKVYTSLDEIIKATTKICKVNLAKQNLNKIPDELYKLKDLKQLDIRNNYIPSTEVDIFKKSLPNCTVLYEPQLAGPPNPNGNTKNGSLRISFANNSLTIDPKTTGTIRMIGDVLEKNPAASIKLKASYQSDIDLKIAEQRMDAIINVLQKYSKYNASQVQKALEKNSSSTRPNMPGVKLGYQLPPGNNIGGYIDVIYSNFPLSFDPNKSSY